MNAFISYSIGDSEQYILSLLAQKLRENGINLVTSYNQTDTIDWQTMNEIKNATFFIGLITKTGRPKKTARVIQELEQTKQYSKPWIILIENGVPVNPWVISNENAIRFDRYFPHQAIEQVNQRIKASKAQPNPDAAAWILGGIGILVYSPGCQKRRNSYPQPPPNVAHARPKLRLVREQTSSASSSV